jgi:hypothetical protein
MYVRLMPTVSYAVIWVRGNSHAVGVGTTTPIRACKNDTRMKEVRNQRSASETACLEVSIVMACQNEADTLEACITKAQQALS